MKVIDQIYIGGQFVKPHGTEIFALISPVSNQLIGQVTLGDESDTQLAIAHAKAAFKTFSKTGREERIAYLESMYQAILKRKDDLISVMLEEYGAPLAFCTASAQNVISSVRSNIETLQQFDLEQKVGDSVVQHSPVGVVGIITPWNSSNGFIASKLSTAIAAGCTAVIKPSELSAMQTQVITECLHEAGLPAGVFNIVNGFGSVVGAEITRHPDIAKISFTGSTLIGKTIARDGVETMKRITLELGGKSPNIILDDADLSQAVPLSVAAAFMNSGQACIAATRLLVPESRFEEVKTMVKETVQNI